MTIFKKILIPIFLFSLISILIYKSEFKFKNSKSDSPPSNYLEKETFIKPSVQVFCQSCHNFVSPSEFSKESWPFIITQMYRLSGSLDSPPGFNRRQDLFDMYKNSPWKKPTEFHPDVNKVIKYYQDNAPTIKDIMDNFHKKSFEIKNTNFKKTMAFRINTNENPTASEIKLIENSIFKPGTKGKGLIVSDLMNGGVHYFSLDYKTQILIGKVKHPTHFEIVDINNDQLMDFIVSDLGVLQTTDTNLGGVYAFINKGEAKFKKIKILGNLGRTAHVKTNITKSGQLNLLISCFGMYSSGGLYLLENLSLKKDKFSFKKIILDKRQGAIKGYFLDINKDGRDDLLTVLSQHYEQVVSYIQQKNGSYKALTLSKADSPTFGSSGLHLTDIDNDNDMDILWINGDVMDNFQVKNN